MDNWIIVIIAIIAFYILGKITMSIIKPLLFVGVGLVIFILIKTYLM